MEYQNQLEQYEQYSNYSFTPVQLNFDTLQNSDDEDSYISCEYLGGGIYELHFIGYDILLNTEIQEVIYTSDVETSDWRSIAWFLTDFKNGAAKVICRDYDKESICILGTDGTITPILEDDWVRALTYSSEGKFELNEDLIYLPNTIIDSPWDEYPTGAYYTIEGEKVIDFPQYREKHEYQCGTFHGGYAPMRITGSDGITYITAIDKSGNPTFEPVSGFEAVYISDDGKYVTAVKSSSLTVFDVKGNPMLSVDCSGIALQVEHEDIEYNVYNDVIRIEDFYVNVSNKTVIGLHKDFDSAFSVKFY